MVADHQGGRHQGGVKFVTAVKQGSPSIKAVVRADTMRPREPKERT
jgi:hypothetical protein